MAIFCTCFLKDLLHRFRTIKGSQSQHQGSLRQPLDFGLPGLAWASQRLNQASRRLDQAS